MFAFSWPSCKFIAWLDGKMEGYDKLIPPPDVLNEELAAHVEAKIRADLTASILREAGFEGRGVPVGEGRVTFRQVNRVLVGKGQGRLCELRGDEAERLARGVG
jgi:hypothetical protein